MIKSQIPIALVAGLAAAMMHSAATVPSLPMVLVFYLAPLPLFLAGFGWGAATVALAALSGFAAVSFVATFKTAAMFALTTGLAPVILVWLALINRPAADNDPSHISEGEASAGGRVWYPEGRLVLWAGIISGAIFVLVVLLVGGSVEGFRTIIAKLAHEMVGEILKSRDMTPEMTSQVNAVQALLVLALPMIAAVFWVFTTVINFRLAMWILQMRGGALRPWARFGAMTFPRNAVFLPAAALAAAMLPDPLGTLAQIIAAGLLAAFTVLGLAVVHGLVKDMPMRAWLLGALYPGLIFLHVIMAGILMMLALADLMFNLRQRMNNRAAGNE